MENYPLTWLKSKQYSKADTEENPTNVLPVEYQNYLNTKEIYSRTYSSNQYEKSNREPVHEEENVLT
jgi:hypothetical protein